MCEEQTKEDAETKHGQSPASFLTAIFWTQIFRAVLAIARFTGAIEAVVAIAVDLDIVLEPEAAAID